MSDRGQMYMGVRGGQGRTAAEVADLGWVWALVVALVAVVLCAVMSGCLVKPQSKDLPKVLEHRAPAQQESAGDLG